MFFVTQKIYFANLRFIIYICKCKYIVSKTQYIDYLPHIFPKHLTKLSETI